MLQNCDFVAALELWAAQAVFPDFEWKLSPFHFVEAVLGEEYGNIGEGEDRLQTVLTGFFFECLDQRAADALLCDLGPNSQRPYLCAGWSIEMESSTAQKDVSVVSAGKVANVL
jgi:hypothetical protein